jgi:putative DNA primase/helicase
VTRGDHQAAIDALYHKLAGDGEKHANGRSTAGQAAFRTDAEILAKCRAAANAAKFATLYDHGDALAYHGGDDSAADLALLRMMAYYTQDPAQLERLFRGSSLMREKFDRNTYRTPTITKALSGLGET